MKHTENINCHRNKYFIKNNSFKLISESLLICQFTSITITLRFSSNLEIKLVINTIQYEYFGNDPKATQLPLQIDVY